MKLILLCITASLAFLNDSLAIPQNFGVGNNGFFGFVGVQFEQYASAPETWQPGAELKGTWRAAATKAPKVKGLETLDLGMDAAVFGIPATQVSVERAGGSVRRFVVRFDETKNAQAGKPAKGGLFSQVTANLTALAGEPKSVSAAGEKTFRYESSTITARRSGAKEVIVEFTPAR
jgi:hypothetical protein